MTAIESAGSRVVAVSTDSLQSSESLASQLQLAFPILEDRDHLLGSAFDVYRLPGGMDMGPVDSHSIFVINRSGQIAWKHDGASGLRAATRCMPLRLGIEEVIAAVNAA